MQILKDNLKKIIIQGLDDDECRTPVSALLNDKSLFQTNSFVQVQKSFKYQYELGKKLGEGAHAIIKECWLKNTNGENKQAVKIVRSDDSEILGQCINIYRIMKRLRHSNIPQSHELYIDNDGAYMVMDLINEDSLLTILKTRGALIEENCCMVIKIYSQRRNMPSGYKTRQYINFLKVLPQNINFIISYFSNQVFLIDFGVAKLFKTKQQNLQQSDQLMTSTGTLHYNAPEIYKQFMYNHKFDIWSIGVIMFQCLFGKLPFDAEDLMENLDQTFINQVLSYHFASTPSISILSQNLLRRLLAYDSNLRLDASGINYSSYLFFQDALRHSLFYSDEKIVKRSMDELDLCLTVKNSEINKEKSAEVQITDFTQIYIQQSQQNQLIQLVKSINSITSFQNSNASTELIKISIDTEINQYEFP